MHHQKIDAVMLLMHCQALLAQPIEHGLTLGCLKHVKNRIAAVRFAHAMGDCQQMQVMVAQQALG